MQIHYKNRARTCICSLQTFCSWNIRIHAYHSIRNIYVT